LSSIACPRRRELDIDTIWMRVLRAAAYSTSERSSSNTAMEEDPGAHSGEAPPSTWANPRNTVAGKTAEMVVTHTTLTANKPETNAVVQQL
jgi:hypothetical protein